MDQQGEEDIPPQREVSPTLRPRGRRRVAVTVTVVAALALVGVMTVRSITGSPARPAGRAPTSESKALGAGEVLTVIGGNLLARDPDSGETRTIVEASSLPGAATITSAAWSPDHKWVAFRKGVGSQAGGLWVADTVGGAPRQLATDVGWSPWAWSPTRDQLVFVLGRNVTLFDAATGRETDPGTTVGAKDSEGYAVHYLVWAPDGARIAYDGGPGSGSVYSIDVKSGEHALLVRRPADTVAIDDIDWSPDGAHLAVSFFEGSQDGSKALYVANADGSDLRLLDHVIARQWPVWHPGLSVGTAWSPDGTRLAYTNLSGSGELQLWTVSMDGSAPSLVASHTLVSDGGGPAWSPDGSQIAFETEAGGGTALDVHHLVANADGTGEPRAIDEVTYLSWLGGWYFCFCYG